MESVRQAIERERERLFIGRQVELDEFSNWFERDPGPTKVISIQGMGGIGKSTLLAEMLRRATASGATALRVDGRACFRTPAGFLDYLGTLLSEQPDLSASSLADVARGGQRVVLGIDNYDDLRLLESWMREELFGDLPATGILVILTSRQGIAPGWLADPAWRGRVEQFTLPPFNRQEIREFLMRFGLEDHSDAESLARESEGLPLALALLSERMVRRPDAVPIVAQDIGAHLLHEVVDSEVHPVLEALAILQEADQDLLGAVLDQPVSTDRYHTLAQLSFISISDHGLAMHDAARAHLLTDLRLRSTNKHRHLRRRAVAALRVRLNSSSSGDHRRYAAHLTAICRDALPVHELSDLTTRPDLLVPTPYRSEDRTRLHDILNAWIRVSCKLTELDEEHRMLDALCDHLPDSIAIFRSHDGECLAFLTQVLLYRETAALLQQYRSGAIYLEQCPPWERAALDCSVEDADTYMSMGGFAALDSSEYSPGELFGMNMHALFGLLTEGMRLIGFGNNPAFLDQINSLGFRVRPECHACFGDAPWPFVVIELDLRERDFGEWVAFLLETLSPELPTGMASDDPVVLDELREALDALDSPHRAQTLALAHRLGQPNHELANRISTLLASDHPPGPLRREDQEILRSAFPRRHRSREEAAARLHMSRATYYRRLRASLMRLAEALIHG